MTEISRRKFIQLTVLGSAVAAVGCKTESRYDDRLYKAEAAGQYGGYNNRVYPYLNQPDGLQDGIPQYYATVCEMCSAGCGLFVRTMGGRAVKVEGNPAHPVNLGKTCARGQASLQHLYNPDRLRQPVFHVKRGATETIQLDNSANPPDSRERLTHVSATPTDWESALTRTVTGLQAAKGRLAILADADTIGRSPTLMCLVNEFSHSVGGSVTTYSLLDDAPWRAASQAVYGIGGWYGRDNQIPAYQLHEADTIVSFGGDFLEAWPSPVYYSRLFGEFRQGLRRKQGEHGKFIYVGPRMSMTAAKADTWLPCNPGTEFAVALGLLSSLGRPGMPLAQAASVSGLTEAQLQSLAHDVRKAGTRALAIGGNGLLSSANPTAAFTAVEAINAQMKSHCIGFGTSAISPPTPNAGVGGIQKLIAQMQAGQIGALVILGQPNPIFTLPTATGFTEALAKVPFIAALTPFEDETTAYADVALPTRAFLEDWGDQIPSVIPPEIQMATLRQPIIDPQFVGGDGQATGIDPPAPWMDTRPTGDILIDLAKRLGKPMADADTHSAVRRMWVGEQADLNAEATDNDTKWVNLLSQGYLAHPTMDGYFYHPMPPDIPNLTYQGPVGPPPAGTFALHLYPHLYFSDGRHANLGWLQENPDPMTMAVWNSWVEINMETAHSLGIRTGDIVRLTSAHGSIEVPAIPYPGLHPNVVAMPIGQGHSVYGRNAADRGINPLAILDPITDQVTGALAYGATIVKLTKLRDARSGYYPDNDTLVLAQDRPGGQEPEAVKDLIHTTAQEWKTAQKVYPSPTAEGSIFHRGGKKE